MKTKVPLLLALLGLLPGVNQAAAQNAAFTYQGRVQDNGSNFTGTGQFKFALVTSTNFNHQATATAVLSGQFVTLYNIISGGSGHVSAPTVTVWGGGGSGATATAYILGGVVTNISAASPGSGYTTTPAVTLSPPPANVSYKTFWSNDGTSTDGSEPAAAVSLAVANGLFTVGLGDTTLANMAAISTSLFTQPNLQLRIWFDDGVNGFAALSPVAELTPAPYAAFANFANSASNTASATSATTAKTFSGSLSGDVTGTQGATVVSTVGAVAAANVASGVNAANAAASGNTPGAIVLRDGSGNFSAGTITLSGTLSMYNSGQNTAVGFDALYPSDPGSDNTAVGQSALYNNTGNNNIGLGFAGGASLTTGDYNIDIGHHGVAGESGTIRIGTQGNQTNTYIAGIIGATSASGIPVYVNSYGQLGTLTSSARFKQDIKSMGDASDVLLALKPVTFRYKPEIDPQGIRQFGLVAEDVDEVDPDLVVRDEEHGIYTVRYQAVDAMLLNEFLKQHRKVEQQRVEIEALKRKAAEVESLEKRLSALEGMLHPRSEAN